MIVHPPGFGLFICVILVVWLLVQGIKAMAKSASTPIKNSRYAPKPQEVGFTVDRCCENNKLSAMWKADGEYFLMLSNDYLDKHTLISGGTLDEIKENTYKICREYAELEQARKEAEVVK